MGLKRAMLLLPGLLVGMLTACEAPMPASVEPLYRTGEFARAAEVIAEDQTPSRRDRRYVLDRMRLAVARLDAGQVVEAQVPLEQTYDLLRTQGINADRTVSSVVFYEGVKIWKGEPFEQALAMVYFGLQQGQLGAWDNLRAACSSALFQLRDFGQDPAGRPIDTLAIAQRALAYEKSGETDASYQGYLDHGYAVRESNFTLGYLLHGIASAQLDRPEEASDFLRVATQLNPALEPLTEQLRHEPYNTVLVVAAGLGPRKDRYGPDGALARFVPRSEGAEDLVVSGRAYPVVTDVNRMATDHAWNNLEDVRLAKASVGQLLMLAGVITAGEGLSHGSDEAALVGLGLLLAGAAARAGAAADIRYADVFPQRFYVVPVQVEGPTTLSVDRVDVTLSPPALPQRAQLIYLRLPLEPETTLEGTAP